MSRESRLAKNTLILTIGNFLPKGTLFVVLPILTGCLTQEEYGTYDLITVLVSLVLPSATLQIQAAAFRFLIDVRDKKNEADTIITNIFAFIIPTSAAALFILYSCLPREARTVKIWICIYFFADILFQGMGQVARGLADNIGYSVSAIVSAVGKVIFTVLFVYILKMGLLGATVALSLATAAGMTILFLKTRLYSRVQIKYLSANRIKELLAYSWPMVPNSMSMWIIRLSDRFVVTFFMGVAANAVYSVANKIPSILTIALNAFIMAWQESASMVSRETDADKYYSEMFRTMFDFMSGFSGVLIAATPILFRILVRGDYAAAYNQIPILFIGMLFFSMSSFLGGIYVAYKETKSIGTTTLAAAFCNLSIDLFLIKRIGLYAASSSTLISYFLLFIFRIINLKKFVNFHYDKKHTIAVFGLMGMECIFCFQQNLLLNCINAIIGLMAFVVLNQPLIKTIGIKLGEKIFRKGWRK